MAFRIPRLAVAVLIVGVSAVALAQSGPMPDGAAAPHDMPMTVQHHPMMMATSQGMPGQPGQAAFGAIQEVVGILESDPATDWSKVNLAALRQHLIDMDEVTLRALAREEPVDGGLRIAITGRDRTLEAIRRMIPAQAAELGRLPGWTARSEPTADGIILTVTSGDAQQAARIRGLGFIGLLASGSHHQQHHLAMARGEFGH